MDASSVAAAALAVALEDSRAAAIRELLLERERAAMTAEDRGSLLAQRLFTGSTQVPSTMRPMTWRAAHRHVQNDMIGARDAMRAALRAHRRGDGDRVERVLVDELGSSSDETEEEEESSHEGGMSDHEDALVCVLCERRQDGNQRRRMIQMAPRGRWVGLAPDARLVCGDCYDAMDPIELAT